MIRLKKRARADRFKSEIRPHKKHRLARNIYLGSLAILGLMIFDMAMGKFLYLQAEGMTSRDLSIVSPEYSGTLQALNVSEGTQVKRGQVLAKLRSQEMLRDIVSASAQLASLQAKLSEMRIRKGITETLMPAAKALVNEAQRESDGLIKLVSKGLVTNQMRNDAASDAFRALEGLKRLETESGLIESEMFQVEKSVERADRALSEIENIYNVGSMVSPADGTVGSISMRPGSVVEEGTPMIEVFHGPPYVLAYIPVGAIYKVRVGDRVSLQYGLHAMSGRVEELLPLAHRLPQEFQKTFDTAQREQLVRIAIDKKEGMPPLFTKVNISWRWSPKAIISSLITKFAG